jgi:magnesium-transporting ATPase (P-type)
MFLFKRKQSLHPTTIFINGIESLTSGQLKVESTWQQTGVTNDLGSMLAKTINNPSDPIDAALLAYTQSRGLLSPSYKPFHAIAFDTHDGISGNIWHHGAEYTPVVKGMPERILEHCEMSDNERESIMIQLHAMSSTGAIIIAVASGLLTYPLKDLKHLKHNDKLTFVGFIALRATLDPEAKRLITNTNVNVYIATGQHPTATQSIAEQLNQANGPHVVYDARRMDVMSSTEILGIVGTVKVFARASSEHKEHILNALRVRDKTTANIKTLADLQKLLAN